MSGNIFVTRAYGGLGQMTLKALLAQKVSPKQLFGMVREPRRPAALALAEQGIQIRRADYTDYNSLTKGFDGIDTLLLIYSGTMENRVQKHANAIRAAQACHVKHIVYTSFLKCTNKSKFIALPDHFQTEQNIKSTRIPYTIFQSTYYANVLPFIMGEAFKTGQWLYPVVDSIKTNYVAKSDIAEALGNVLRTPHQHINKTYEITSEKTYNFIEIAEIISKSVGIKITYCPVTLDEYKMGLEKHGLRDIDLRYLTSSTEIIADGDLNIISPDLKNLLGKKPKTLEEYLPTLFRKK